MLWHPLAWVSEWVTRSFSARYELRLKKDLIIENIVEPNTTRRQREYYGGPSYDVLFIIIKQSYITSHFTVCITDTLSQHVWESLCNRHCVEFKYQITKAQQTCQNCYAVRIFSDLLCHRMR